MTVVNDPSDRKSPETRVYRSPARERAAADTRRRIVEASAARFSRDGYAGTTMKGIAAEAGVSVETVNNHGPKRDLLMAAFELAFAEREGPAPMGERPDFGAAAAEPDPERALALMVAATTDAFARSDRIWRAVLTAAEADDEVAAAVDELLGRRHLEFVGIVARMTALGVDLPADVERAAQAIEFIVTHESFHHFVLRCGWTRQAYESWVVRSILAQAEVLRA